MSFEYLISIPKSFYVSWRLTDFISAFRLPCVVRYNTVLHCLSGHIVLSKAVKSKLIFGIGDCSIYDKRHNRSILDIKGTVNISGAVCIGPSAKISVGHRGQLSFHGSFRNSAGVTIVCQNRIDFYERVRVGWDTLFTDTDFHETILTESNTINVSTKPILLGNNVWVGSRCMILKGTEIANNCIIGAGSIVTKSFLQESCLIAGNPASVRKVGVTRYFKE